MIGLGGGKMYPKFKRSYFEDEEDGIHSMSFRQKQVDDDALTPEEEGIISGTEVDMEEEGNFCDNRGDRC
jgi:hypothetical protein